MQRIARPALNSLRAPALRYAPRRFASTASPADKGRSWKSSALRWGVAVGAVYYYSTNAVFADEATDNTRFASAPSSFIEHENKLPTVDSVIEEKRKQASAVDEVPKPAKSQTDVELGGKGPSSPEALEDEAGQQGAFNPETGEINWDCPCLGGMADGPCGPEFKEAFSCFVYSNEEPKGMDCIDKFQGMQECFRKYPEIYGSELADEEDAGPDFGTDDAEAAPATKTAQTTESESAEFAESAVSDAVSEPSETKEAAALSVNLPSDTAVPEETLPKWEDATAANKEVEKQDQQPAETEQKSAEKEEKKEEKKQEKKEEVKTE